MHINIFEYIYTYTYIYTYIYGYIDRYRHMCIYGYRVKGLPFSVVDWGITLLLVALALRVTDGAQKYGYLDVWIDRVINRYTCIYM